MNADIPYTVKPLSDGHFEVSRIINGRKVIWGRYSDRGTANRNCTFANQIAGVRMQPA